MQGALICQSIIGQIHGRLYSKDFFDTYRLGNAFSRNRKLSFHNTLLFLLRSSKKSMAIDMDDFSFEFPQINFPPVTKQAVSKARNGIKPSAFKDLFGLSVSGYYSLQDSRKTWNGYHLLAIDGTSLQLPQNSQNIEEFGATLNQHNIPVAMASASILYDLTDDVVMDATVETFHYSEREMALGHLGRLKELGVAGKNTIILFDRGYPSYSLYREIQDMGAYFVVRLSSNMHLAPILEEGTRDYTPRGAKEPIRLRTVKVILDDGTVETLVTNILDPSFTEEMFKELYFYRWGIEGKYRELKNRLEIEEFSGSRPSSVRQDFFISMLLSNLAGFLKADADQFEVVPREGTDPCHYQANRGFIISRVHKYLVHMLLAPQACLAQLERIVWRAKKVRSQIRDGRKYERKHKQLRRKHHNNRKPVL